MAVIVLPENPVQWRSGRWSLERADAAQEFVNGARQVTAYPKALWTGTIELPPLERAEAGRWKAALAQLSSLANTFEAGPPDYQEGPGTGYDGPAPRIAGAGQLGLSLDVDGLPANTEILAPGDYFHVGAGGVRELKMVTAPVVSGSAGAATINFQPAMRNAPLDGVIVEVFAPFIRFALVNPNAAWSLSVDGFTRFSFDVIEAFAP